MEDPQGPVAFRARDGDVVVGPPAPAPRTILDQILLYLELGKAGLTVFIVSTTLVGFLVASRGDLDGMRLLLTLIGTGLTSLGSLALNQWMEQQPDARMTRTRRRPLPSGRMQSAHAFRAAGLSVLSGLAILGLLVNLLTAALALLIVVVYALLYTPLKSRSPLCTLVGAVCGAIPPMMGYSAATGQVALGGWILAAVLFVWQIPHFLALAWLYRDDYARGGFLVLSVLDRSGQLTGRMVILYSMALLPLGMVAAIAGIAGTVFLAGSILLGCALLYLGIRLHQDRSLQRARLLFAGSLVYLSLLLLLLVVDPGPAARTSALRKTSGGRPFSSAIEKTAPVALHSERIVRFQVP
jgi:protoheme IX farnesyltransferase